MNFSADHKRSFFGCQVEEGIIGVNQPPIFKRIAVIEEGIELLVNGGSKIKPLTAPAI
jgi:hypothetical protein